jgi:hypothetical protein
MDRVADKLFVSELTIAVRACDSEWLRVSDALILICCGVKNSLKSFQGRSIKKSPKMEKGDT